MFSKDVMADPGVVPELAGPDKAPVHRISDEAKIGSEHRTL
jgi:hypothetical protein